MQLMPETLRDIPVRNAFDPTANIDAGARHLRTLLDRYPLDTALAAYNAGDGAVIRYGGDSAVPETRSLRLPRARTLDARRRPRDADGATAPSRRSQASKYPKSSARQLGPELL